MGILHKCVDKFPLCENEIVARSSAKKTAQRTNQGFPLSPQLKELRLVPDLNKVRARVGSMVATCERGLGAIHLSLSLKSRTIYWPWVSRYCTLFFSTYAGTPSRCRVPQSRAPAPIHLVDVLCKLLSGQNQFSFFGGLTNLFP